MSSIVRLIAFKPKSLEAKQNNAFFHCEHTRQLPVIFCIRGCYEMPFHLVLWEKLHLDATTKGLLFTISKRSEYEMCDGQTAGSTGGHIMVSEALFASSFNCHPLCSLVAEEVEVLMLLVPSEVPPVSSLISFIPELPVDGGLSRLNAGSACWNQLLEDGWQSSHFWLLSLI